MGTAGLRGVGGAQAGFRHLFWVCICPASPAFPGCFVSGLYLEGADWDIEAGCLVKSKPKVLVVDLPILKIIPIEAHRLKLQVRPASWPGAFPSLGAVGCIPAFLVGHSALGWEPAWRPRDGGATVVTCGVDGRPPGPCLGWAHGDQVGMCPAETAAWSPMPPSPSVPAEHLPDTRLHHLPAQERHGGRLGLRGGPLHHQAHFPLGAPGRVPHPEFRLSKGQCGSGAGLGH